MIRVRSHVPYNLQSVLSKQNIYFMLIPLTSYQHWLTFQGGDRILQLLGKLLEELSVNHRFHVAAQVVDQEPVSKVALLCNEIKVGAASPVSTSLWQQYHIRWSVSYSGYYNVSLQYYYYFSFLLYLFHSSFHSAFHPHPGSLQQTTIHYYALLVQNSYLCKKTPKS